MRTLITEGYNRNGELVSFELTNAGYQNLIQVRIDGVPQLDKSVTITDTYQGAINYIINYARNTFGVTELDNI